PQPVGSAARPLCRGSGCQTCRAIAHQIQSQGERLMTPPTSAAPQAPVRFERRYENAQVQDLWELWTTKEGFESWWGPEGFRVAVHKLDLRSGGELVYDMIASGPDQIEFMKKANMPLSHTTRARFGEIVPLRQLELVHVVDFVPG